MRYTGDWSILYVLPIVVVCQLVRNSTIEDVDCHEGYIGFNAVVCRNRNMLLHENNRK